MFIMSSIKSLHCQTQTRYQIFSWLAFLHFQVFWHTKYIFFRIDKNTFANNSQVLQFSNTPSFYVYLVSNFSLVDFQRRLSINDHFISQLMSVKDNAYDNISTLKIFIFYFNMNKILTFFLQWCLIYYRSYHIFKQAWNRKCLTFDI